MQPVQGHPRFKTGAAMSQRDLIESIQKINPTAPTDFLAAFTEEELLDYLRQLQSVRRTPARQDAPPLALAG